MALSLVGVLTAFGAGLLSFLSPCVLPLVPGYLSYLAGTSIQEAHSLPTVRFRVIGMAFGAGWSACSGPILGAILVLTAVRSTVLPGVIFLLVYALGLGVPFVLVGLLVDRASRFMRPIRRYARPLSFLGGVILILMGMLLLTSRLDQLANLLFPFSFSP